MITSRSTLYCNTWSGYFRLWKPEITNYRGKSILVRVSARFSKGWSYRESTLCIISFKATVLYWLICDPLLTSTFSNAPWCWLRILSWLNWLQISFSFLGLLLFVIFPCLCWLYILRFPRRSLPSLFVAFLCEFDSDYVLRPLCSMRASSPRVLDQESPERPRRACSQAMLCTARVVADFVGLWCLLHVLLYLVDCVFSSSLCPIRLHVCLVLVECF